MEACDWGLSNKTKLDIESPEGPTIVEPRRNFWLLHPLDCWKMHFLIPEKYSIINKYKTNSPSPKYYIIFAQISKIKFWKIFKKKKKKQNSRKFNHMPVDIPWKNMLKIFASPKDDKFCEWFQVGIDVSVPHCKHPAQHRSSPWF